MRKVLCAVCLTAAAAFATSAQAAPRHYQQHYYGYAEAPYAATPYYSQPDNGYILDPHVAAPVAGVVGGTLVGVGISQGWFGAAAVGTALPLSAVGAAAVGGTVGMGAIALVDAALEPCRGFAAAFDINHGRCVNGHYVGYVEPTHEVIRHHRYYRYR